MKQHLVKQLISFTAALTLCVTVFVGTPVGGTFIPDRTNNSPTILSGDYQEGEAPGQDGQEPGIAPQNDQKDNIDFIE